MSGMLGLDTEDCAAFVACRVNWEKLKDLKGKAGFLCDVLVREQVRYLHVCGALDETGDTGEGEYDEDDAAEFLLDALIRVEPTDDKGEMRYCVLIDQFLPLFDDYLLINGLLTF